MSVITVIKKATSKLNVGQRAAEKRVKDQGAKERVKILETKQPTMITVCSTLTSKAQSVLILMMTGTI